MAVDLTLERGFRFDVEDAMPNHKQFLKAASILAGDIIQRRKDIITELMKHPVPILAFYSDGWKSKINKRAYIELSMTYMSKNGDRRQQSLGILDFQYVTENNINEITDKLEDLQLSQSQREIDWQSTTEAEDELNEEEFHEEIENICDDTVCLDDDPDKDLIDDYEDGVYVEEGECMEEETWMATVDKGEFKEIEFTDKLGQKVKIMVTRQTAVQIAVAVRDIMYRVGFESFAAKQSDVFKTVFVTDSGL